MPRTVGGDCALGGAKWTLARPGPPDVRSTIGDPRDMSWGGGKLDAPIADLASGFSKKKPACCATVARQLQPARRMFAPRLFGAAVLASGVAAFASQATAPLQFGGSYAGLGERRQKYVADWVSRFNDLT